MYAEGRNSGGPSNQQDPHRSPPDMTDESPEEHDQQGRNTHLDHITQLHTTSNEHSHQQLRNTPAAEKEISPQPTTTTRRGHKRRLRADSGHSSSNEEEAVAEDSYIVYSQHKSAGPAALSPASSSCHSTSGTRQPVSTAEASPATVTAMTATESDTATTGTSVKDLEHAMSKHLPSNMLTSKSASPQPHHQPTDFSTDALLKQQQQRSTIQWIGAHHAHLNAQQQHQVTGGSTTPLPASALLRQLYANRESVIRANVHGITSASAGGRGGSTGSYYTSPDQVGPLPTPPGSEGSYSEHQFMLQHQKSTNGDAFGSLAAAYTATGHSYSAMDYHNAMTPPSSVSPRDKQQLGHTGVSFDNTVPMYSDVLRHQYNNDGSPAQPLPLKPQVYSAVHPSALDAYVSSAPLDQSQFYHHGATGAGFHLYHPTNKTGSNSTNWYSTS